LPQRLELLAVAVRLRGGELWREHENQSPLATAGSGGGWAASSSAGGPPDRVHDAHRGQRGRHVNRAWAAARHHGKLRGETRRWRHQLFC
jgi:hypothetical protein